MPFVYGGNLSNDPEHPVTMRDVNDQLEAFRDRPWVHACISRISSAMKQAPLKVYTGGPAGKGSEVEDHPLLDLWRLPNPQTTGRLFRAEMMIDLEAAGNFYAEVVYGSTLDSVPLQMWRITPARMRIVVDSSSGEVAGYLFDPGGGAKLVPLEPQQVWHRRYVNPLDDYRGMAPLLAARDSAVWEELAMRENVKLMRNGMRASGVLTGPEKAAPETLAMARQLLRLRTAGRSQGEPLVLPGEWQWIDTTTTPHDADWIEGRRMSREEQCAVFGVPPPVAGDMTKSTYSNYEEAVAWFWSSTIAEKYSDLDEDLSVKVAPLFQDALWCEHDLGDTPAGAEDDDAKVTRTVAAWQGGLYTLDEAREEIGEEEIGGDAGNVRRIPISVQEVQADETAADRAEASGLPVGGDPGGGAAPPDGGGAPAASPPTPPPGGTGGAAGKSLVLEAPAVTAADLLQGYRQAWLDSFLQQRTTGNTGAEYSDFDSKASGVLSVHQVIRAHRTDGIVEASMLALRKTMRQQRDELVRWVESSGTKAANPKEPLPEHVPELVKSYGWTAARQRFLKAIRSTHLLAVEQAWHAGAEALGVDSAYNLHDPRVVHRLASLADRPDGVKSITLGVRDEVLAEVKDGLARGAGIDQIVNGGSWVDLQGEKQTMRGITGVYEPWTGGQAWRAERVARTETGVAYNVSTTDAYGEAGVKHVLVMDGTDDGDCAEADGSTWTLDEAAANPLGHPNCVRAFAPVVD